MSAPTDKYIAKPEVEDAIKSIQQAESQLTRMGEDFASLCQRNLDAKMLRSFLGPAVTYKHHVLPQSIVTMTAVKDVFEMYMELSFEDWKESLELLLEDAKRGYATVLDQIRAYASLMDALREKTSELDDERKKQIDTGLSQRLKEFGVTLEALVDLFQNLIAEMGDLQDCSRPAVNDAAKAHFLKYKAKASILHNTCSKFIAAVPKMKSQLQSIPNNSNFEELSVDIIDPAASEELKTGDKVLVGGRSGTIGFGPYFNGTFAITYEDGQREFVQPKDAVKVKAVHSKVADTVPAPTPAVPGSEAKPKLLEPQFVKVKNGIAYIYATFGDTLVYIEAETQKLYGSVHVWAIDKSQTLQSALERHAGPPCAKLSALAGSGKAKVLSVTEPINAAVSNGVLRIKGGIDGGKLYVEIKASEYWTACTEQALALRQGVVERRLKPLGQMYSSSKDKVVGIMQPYYVRGRDGALHIRATVGDTLVSIKLGVGHRMDYLQNVVLTAYGNVSNVIASYMSPIITRAVVMYESISKRLLTVFGPYLARAQEGVTFGRAKVQGVLVAIKVQSGAAYQRAAALPAACYVTINRGFIYVRGEVDGKALLLKVKLSDVYDRAKEIFDMTKVKVLEAKEVTRTKIMALSAGARSAAGEQGVQVTAASAAGGAMAVGATGGAAGLLVGGALGAACGVPLSFFTFGLSIPVGAAIGGGTGLCAGSAAGGAVGGAVGGVAGRKVYNKREAIADGYSAAVSKVGSYKDLAVEKAGNCTTAIGESATGLRARMGA